MHELLLNAHHLLGASDAADPSVYQLIEIHANVMGGQDVFQAGHLAAQTLPNIGGGQSLFEAGHLVETTHSTLGGGVDVISSHGSLMEHAQPNLMGGQDIYANGHLVASTHAGLAGTTQVFDSHGALAATASPGIGTVHITPGFGDQSAVGAAAVTSNFFTKHFGS
jgi:YD repeat-containing protein